MSKLRFFSVKGLLLLQLCCHSSLGELSLASFSNTLLSSDYQKLNWQKISSLSLIASAFREYQQN